MLELITLNKDNKLFPNFDSLRNITFFKFFLQKSYFFTYHFMIQRLNATT